jgi:predicted dienelactone hydrolase
MTQLTAASTATESQIDFSKQADLRLAGPFSWQLQTLNLKARRNRTLTVDLYLPFLNNETSRHLAPVIVISHGAAEDRTSFTYLAKHLASYGFAVAVVEHPGNDSERFGQYFAGLAGPPEPVELLNQPMEVTQVLDRLQQMEGLQGQLNLQQVGVIGHSLGGYAALTLAGATINSQLDRDCRNNQFLNISILVQCRATELPPLTYSLQDKRVKAVIAVNPVTSTILGQSGLSQIQIPLMLVAGSADIVTPVVPEQIRPFTWLTTANKYLVLIENATHFSTVGELAPGHAVLPVPPALIGPNPAIARSYLSALSVAFLQTHIANRPEYRSYLSASYAKFITQTPLNLNFMQSFTAEQLAETLKRTPARSSVSSKNQLPTSSRSGVDSKL